MMAVLNAALLAAAIAVRRFAPARAAPHVIN
jgi:hypothetical protein